MGGLPAEPLEPRRSRLHSRRSCNQPREGTFDEESPHPTGLAERARPRSSCGARPSVHRLSTSHRRDRPLWRPCPASCMFACSGDRALRRRSWLETNDLEVRSGRSRLELILPITARSRSPGKRPAGPRDGGASRRPGCRRTRHRDAHRAVRRPCRRRRRRPPSATGCCSTAPPVGLCAASRGKACSSARRPALTSQVQLIAANVDTLLVVSSCNQDFNLARLERYLALAREADVTPVVVLTKADLADAPRRPRAARRKADAGSSGGDGRRARP